MGLPYLLGDKDPKDPIAGWDKTWAYLKELNSCIEYYPTGTGAVMKELGEGSRDMTVTVTGWDINPRALGIVPKQFKVAALNGFTWVNDAHYMVMPKGLPAARQAVVLELMAFMLKPEQQALTYDEGYFYPGPAVKNVPLSMAPQREPGRHQGIRPPRICGLDCRTVRMPCRWKTRPWWLRSSSGTRKSAAQKTSKPGH